MWIFKLVILLFCVAIGYTQSESQIGRRRAVPVLYVQGSHYDVGFDMGRNFASVIKSFLATYNNLREFEAEYSTDAGRKIYYETLANMKERFPYYVKEIQGIADGAKVPFYQLFLLHLDDLIMTANDNRVPRGDTGGCSSIGVNNRQNTVLGHTEDAFSETVNHFYIVHAHVIPTPEDAELGAREERFASLCYAGQLPGYTSGFNEHGLVFSINTLSPHQLKHGSTPRTFITRNLMSSKNFSDAERILRDEGLGIGNGFSVNMIWSDAKRAVEMYNVEVAPDFKTNRSRINVHKYQNEMLVHCNMYERLPVTNVIGDIIDSSAYRIAQIRSYPQAQSKQEVANILSDTTGEEYRIFQDQQDKVIKTIAAGIFDVGERTWSIYINRPNASEPIAVIPIIFKALDKIH